MFNNVEVKVTGRGSRLYSKLTYNIKLPKDGDSTLYGYRRVKLQSLSSDPSYIRESVIYNALISAGLAATRLSYVRVFINNGKAGIYRLVENFKNPWFRNIYGNGDKDYRQGYAYQGSSYSPVSRAHNHIFHLSYYKDNVTVYTDGQYRIKKISSDKQRSYQPLMELIRFLSEAPTDSEDAAFMQWEKHFNMKSVLRNIALEVLFGFSDGYSILHDNYIMYQEGIDSNQYAYIPYDPEYSLGDTLVKLDDILTVDYRVLLELSVQALTSKFLLVPGFKKRFETLLKHLAVNLVNLDVLGPCIDSTVEMIQKDVRWDLSLEPLSHSNFMLSEDSWPWRIDKKTVEDLMNHTFHATIPFDAAVNGPTGSISSCDVKEFIANKTRAINDFS